MAQILCPDKWRSCKSPKNQEKFDRDGSPENEDQMQGLPEKQVTALSLMFGLA
jgi:hypothetical protein